MPAEWPVLSDGEGRPEQFILFFGSYQICLFSPTSSLERLKATLAIPRGHKFRRTWPPIEVVSGFWRIQSNPMSIFYLDLNSHWIFRGITVPRDHSRVSLDSALPRVNDRLTSNEVLPSCRRSVYDIMTLEHWRMEHVEAQAEEIVSYETLCISFPSSYMILIRLGRNMKSMKILLRNIFGSHFQL